MGKRNGRVFKGVRIARTGLVRVTMLVRIDLDNVSMFQEDAPRDSDWSADLRDLKRDLRATASTFGRTTSMIVDVVKVPAKVKDLVQVAKGKRNGR